MNARLPAPAVIRESVVPPWDQENERHILGLAMLAYPMPAWIEPQHFFPTQHQRIYEAVLDVGGCLPKVNVWLRESASKWKAPIAGPAELAAMCLEADHAQRMGWAADFERLRELWRQRGLLDTMARVAIRLRHEALTHEEARAELRRHFLEVR